MSNVKSITRPKSGHSRQSSESSESSIDSIPTLAGKVAKILSEEDAKNKFDATTNAMKSPSKGKEVKESSKSDPLLRYFNVEVCNRYGVLADKSVEMEVQDEEQPQPSTSTAQESQQQQKRSGTSNAKPPALCFVSRMKERFLFGRKHARLLQKAGRLQAFCGAVLERSAVLHLHPARGKTLAFLIKGLHYECECEDVKNELIELNISVKSVVKFKNTKHPIFMITVPKTVTIKQLQVQVRTASRRRVAATAGGHHPASSTQCPTYKKALAEKQRKSKPAQRKNEAQTRYVLAPLPTRNAWDRRDFPALPTKAANVAPRPPRRQTRGPAK
ncbi:hypothetical protein Trydic_g12936 [Trypoxylus dichotomus]